MKGHAADRPFGRDVVYTAAQELCPDCGRRAAWRTVPKLVGEIKRVIEAG
jgi:hypothetical protein